jgi:hypothetical protein
LSLHKSDGCYYPLGYHGLRATLGDHQQFVEAHREIVQQPRSFTNDNDYKILLFHNETNLRKNFLIFSVSMIA